MSPESRVKLLAVARGDLPADLLLTNGRIIDVFSGEIICRDIAICGDRIAGVGTGYRASRAVDLQGAFVSPGLVDAHVHIESSLCIPSQFAPAVAARGITSVVADPHEIANVAGLSGIRFMADDARDLPLRIVTMAPSCVPATSMSGSGAALSAADLVSLLESRIVHGLAEVMNFPGVIGGDPAVLEKLAAFPHQPIDGHCPSAAGRALNAYVASGIGSDHECVSIDEAREKLSRGLYILIREATNAHDLHALLPLITDRNHRRICLCTDDRQPADLLSTGGIDHMLRETISAGIDPMIAFRLCTLNPTEWFGLHDRGAIAPGRLADLMIFDDLQRPEARQVFVGGRDWTEVQRSSTRAIPPTHSFHRDIDSIDWRIPATDNCIRVIGSIDGQLITEHRILPAKIIDGFAVADVHRDVLKMMVINRHGNSSIGRGFIQGIGLKRGAIAGTVAHDHHNLVVIGCDDESMAAAARLVAKSGGGLAASDGTALPLPIAGLMSDRPIAEVRDNYQALLNAARQLGSPLHDPFMAMSFMALEVIPALKLTDRGLVDVDQFKIIPLFAS
ncbi:MAG: adenine deaminase [Phycisphaerae bacterium]|nr:adenine deaminase [Phycisphaerae bacterium]